MRALTQRADALLGKSLEVDAHRARGESVAESLSCLRLLLQRLERNSEPHPRLRHGTLHAERSAVGVGGLRVPAQALQDSAAKRLQLVKEIVPAVTRVAVLWDQTMGSLQLGPTEAAARSLGLSLESLPVRGPADIEAAFQTATRKRAGAPIGVSML